MRKIKWWARRAWIGFVIWFLSKSADDTFELNWKKLGPELWQKCAPALPYVGLAIGSATAVTGGYFIVRFLYERFLRYGWAVLLILLLVGQARVLLISNSTQKAKDEAFALLMAAVAVLVMHALIVHLQKEKEQKAIANT